MNKQTKEIAQLIIQHNKLLKVPVREEMQKQYATHQLQQNVEIAP